jgi:hypothetical protein
MSRGQFTNRDFGVVELVYITDEIVADLSAGRVKDAEARLAVALVLAKDNKKSHFLSVVAEIQMAQAILAKKAADFDAAVENHISEHIKSYSPSSVNHYPGGLFDMVALGMVSIAKRYNVDTSVQSVYLPLELLEN